MKSRTFVVAGLPALLMPRAGVGQTAGSIEVAQAGGLRVMRSRRLWAMLDQWQIANVPALIV